MAVMPVNVMLQVTPRLPAAAAPALHLAARCLGAQPLHVLQVPDVLLVRGQALLSWHQMTRRNGFSSNSASPAKLSALLTPPVLPPAPGMLWTVVAVDPRVSATDAP